MLTPEEISLYEELEGDFDLEEENEKLQEAESLLDCSGAGVIERPEITSTSAYEEQDEKELRELMEAMAC